MEMKTLLAEKERLQLQLENEAARERSALLQVCGEMREMSWKMREMSWKMRKQEKSWDANEIHVSSIKEENAGLVELWESGDVYDASSLSP